jgi:hypothetical protein
VGAVDKTDPPVRDHKDFWDILQIVLSPVGGLLTAIAVASLGFVGSRTLERQQANEAKLRLYSELMTRREESEATLRKEMFQSIIGSFFDASASTLETRLLKMELLAQNFHEALNLVPLFEHIQREIGKSNLTPESRRDYEARLGDLAREVTRKQMIVLEAGGKRHDWTVVFSDSLVAGSGSQQCRPSGTWRGPRDRDTRSAGGDRRRGYAERRGLSAGLLQHADDRQYTPVQ